MGDTETTGFVDAPGAGSHRYLIAALDETGNIRARSVPAEIEIEEEPEPDGGTTNGDADGGGGCGCSKTGFAGGARLVFMAGFFWLMDRRRRSHS
jgi:hypothetical protein